MLTVPKKKSSLWNRFSRSGGEVGSSALVTQPRDQNSQIHPPTASSHHPYNDAGLFANRTPSISSTVSRPVPPPDPVRQGPDKYGLYTIYDGLKDRRGTSRGRDFPVDIVAVHGLNGDCYRTWTAVDGNGQNVNWLRDFLPLEFPGSRIYTFGYPSELFHSLDTGDLDTAARSLLNWLLLARRHRHVWAQISSTELALISLGTTTNHSHGP